MNLFFNSHRLEIVNEGGRKNTGDGQKADLILGEFKHMRLVV